ncbi:MAG: hypothetical protein E6R14_12670 [Thermomicrobiales bacterium]|nr:MAG: hypothetical protein E6R14_12670 [Thermomicrobiales bacterium]
MKAVKHSTQSANASLVKRAHQALRLAIIGAASLSALALSGFTHAAGRVFYDGFESGNTNLWSQDDFRNRCSVVTSAADGKSGPYAGTYMTRCNSNGAVAWNDAAAYETLKLSSLKYTNEVFVRVRMRVDSNHEKTTGSAKKIFRFYNLGGGNEMYSDLPGDSLKNMLIVDGKQFGSYWGGASGDNTGSTSGWHKVEWYFNASTGQVRVWHDGALIRDIVQSFGGQRWDPFYLTSNWADGHDSTNYIYFDEFEVYSDQGSGASGSMSSATASAGSSTTATTSTPPAPGNLSITGAN